jgi:hypothetical protein
MIPTSCPFIVLEEYRLVMCDKDKGTQIGGQMRKEIPIVVPNLESCFIFRPSINKGLSIGHNTVLLMFINIHAVFVFAIVPL